MRKITIVALSLSLLAGNAATALAQHRDEGRDRDDRRHEEHFDRDRGHPEWREGYHMDHGDWNRGRYVDHRDYRLREPPRGYEWREVDGRFILGAVATGIIADIILNAR